MKFRISWIILSISLLLIAGRTILAAQSGLRVDSPQSKTRVNRKQDMLVMDAARGDSLIRNASAARRNPFGAPVSRVVPGPRVTKPVEPPPEPVKPPRVMLFMQDEGSTVVQLEVEGEASGRMGVGSSFRGWTITSITESAVTVVKENSRFNLPRP